jgi:two-component system response regulator HydG
LLLTKEIRNKMAYSILIVEDDLTFSTMLSAWLKRKGFMVETASNNSQSRKLLNDKKFDLVLSDYRLPDDDGTYLLSWMNEMKMNIPFIMMTNYADIQTAVQTMKSGAADFLSKPIQPDELLKKISEALNKSSQKINSSAEDIQQPSFSSNDYIEGGSEASRQLYNYVDLVAPTPMSVLIFGASGTGKEYIAHRIHQHSKRANKPFLAIDCGSIPKELASSEFFGHIKGSFTGALSDKVGAFEEVNGGTLFLDEIGNLSYDVQVQLLRALQERRIRRIGSNEEIEVDIRLICATNEDLSIAIEKGTFREDLYHRINEFTLKMPTLSECREDIMIYANFFLDQANKELDRHLIGFDDASIAALQSYMWPGNLRQLKNTIKRATLLAKSDFITKFDLDPDVLQVYAESPTIATLHDESTEKERILKALQHTNNNKSKAAQLLDIDRKTLYNKMKLYDINL